MPEETAKKSLAPVRSRFVPAGGGRALHLDSCDVSGKVRILRVECQVPEGAEADTFVIGLLPSGHSLFLGHQSLLEVTKVPKDAKFSVGLGALQEPLGERVPASPDRLVSLRALKGTQSLLGNLDQAKVRASATVEVLLTTDTPLEAGTVIRGYLAFASD